MPRNSNSSGVSPLTNFVIGGACITAYAVCACFTILTDQSLMQGGNGSGVKPSLEVLYQPWNLAHGMYSGLTCVSIILSWLIFLCYVICTAGYAAYQEHLDGKGKGLGRFFHSAMMVIIVFDGYANYEYAHIFPNPFWQFFVALLIGFTLFFIGPLGYHKIAEGIADMNA